MKGHKIIIAAMCLVGTAHSLRSVASGGGSSSIENRDDLDALIDTPKDTALAVVPDDKALVAVSKQSPPPQRGFSTSKSSFQSFQKVNFTFYLLV